ncbi:MAG: hypothetical protein AAGF23_21355, partial [Acidobacteriota bacterium]
DALRAKLNGLISGEPSQTARFASAACLLHQTFGFFWTGFYVVDGEELVVRQPDIVIVEGLNVLQVPDKLQPKSQRVFVSDFFDFSIYVDARPEVIEQWYVERFLTLRETVFTDADSYFHRYAHLSDAQAQATAERIWRTINGPNLENNIEPTRERAHLILEKGDDHVVQSVRLRRL